MYHGKKIFGRIKSVAVNCITMHQIALISLNRGLALSSAELMKEAVFMSYKYGASY